MRSPQRGRKLPPVGMIVLLGLLSSIGPAAFDIYVPGVPEVARDLGAPQWLAQATMGSFMVGLGIGQLVFGSVSDIFGRRRPLLLALGLFAAASAACAVAPTIEVLLAARCLQGVAAASGVVISRAVIRDLHAGAEGARMLSRIVMIYGLAPVLAPILGAQVLAVTDWRGVFAVLLGFALALAILAALLLPETHPRERRRSGFPQTGADIALLLRTPGFVAHALVVGFACAALASYVATSTFVFQDLFGVSPQGYSLLFGGMALGVIAGSGLNAHLLRRHPPDRLLAVGVGLGTAAGAAMLALALAGAPLALLSPTLFLSMFAFGMVPSNAVALAMADHPERAGSASSLLGLFQYGTAAIAVPVVGVFGSGSAVPMAAAVCGLYALCLPTLWVGRRLRGPGPAPAPDVELATDELLATAEADPAGLAALGSVSRLADERGSERSQRPDR